MFLGRRGAEWLLCTRPEWIIFSEPDGESLDKCLVQDTLLRLRVSEIKSEHPFLAGVTG